MKHDFREEQILQIAEMYYDHDMTQDKIAALVGISRPSVSRLLDEAKRRKLVEVIIHKTVPKNKDLSDKIRKHFGIQTCVVTEGTGPSPLMLKNCVKAAGDFFYNILQDGMIVTIPCGEAVNLFADILAPKQTYHNVHIAKSVGWRSTGNAKHDGMETARKIARKLGAKYSNIHAPAFVESTIVRDYLLKEPQIIAEMNMAMTADIAITGVFAIGYKDLLYNVKNLITEQEMEQFLAKGGTNAIMGHIIDKDGKEIVLENKMLISIPLETMRKITLTMGISVSEKNAHSVFTAIKAGYINSLFIDEELAKALLELKGIQTEVGK
jgi:DNA-binding transcriptional regulator LsrR (DeoR family)